jgi:hypothetical protein
MQDSSSLALLVVGKDAEINMLREQLSQLSADLNRNLAVSCARHCNRHQVLLPHWQKT